MAVLESLLTPRPRQRQFLHRSYIRRDDPPELPHKGSQALAKKPKDPRLPLPEPDAVHEAIESVARRRMRIHDQRTDTMVQRRSHPRVQRMTKASFRWHDQAPDAPLWLVRCAATGVVMARVRGTDDWVLGQCGLFVDDLREVSISRE